ncbi:hypothetical protein F5Y13DRAFT_98042 [Hypoxylon sp. FL1857]|nr:hypothetical protein F5Y13DRAFT_98042 [Hypoxylon sp. FL1857]
MYNGTSSSEDPTTRPITPLGAVSGGFILAVSPSGACSTGWRGKTMLICPILWWCCATGGLVWVYHTRFVA